VLDVECSCHSERLRCKIRGSCTRLVAVRAEAFVSFYIAAAVKAHALFYRWFQLEATADDEGFQRPPAAMVTPEAPAHSQKKGRKRPAASNKRSRESAFKSAAVKPEALLHSVTVASAQLPKHADCSLGPFRCSLSCSQTQHKAHCSCQDSTCACRLSHAEPWPGVARQPSRVRRCHQSQGPLHAVITGAMLT
jgi:hypothetical protein